MTTRARRDARFAAASRALRESAALVAPVWCAGCGAFGGSLCGPCRGLLRDAIRPRTELLTLADGRLLPLVTACAYEGIVPVLVNAFKEEGRLDVARWLAGLARVAAGELSLPASAPDGVARRALELVPLPSRAQAVRRRGYRHGELLCREAFGVRVDPHALRVTRALEDQAGLSRAARVANVHGAMRASPRLADRGLILVDDVVTTGASLREAIRAVCEVDAIPLAAIAIARSERSATSREECRFEGAR